MQKFYTDDMSETQVVGCSKFLPSQRHFPDLGIRMEFLCSILRRHFTGKPVCQLCSLTISNVTLSFPVSNNMTIYILYNFDRFFSYFLR